MSSAKNPAPSARPILDEMLSACRKNNVQFMDGVMFMHSQRLARVRETLDDGASVGQIKRIVRNSVFPEARIFSATTFA